MARVSLEQAVEGLKGLGYNVEVVNKTYVISQNEKIIDTLSTGRELVAYYKDFLPSVKKSDANIDREANRLAVEYAVTTTSIERKREIRERLNYLLGHNANDLHEETSSMISQMVVKELD